jgi:nucleotide-binding universal stress UspA family protein
MNNVVVGVDDTPESRLALRWAVDHAQARHLPLLVLNVYSVPVMYAGSMYTWPPNLTNDELIISKYAEETVRDAVAYAQEVSGQVETHGQVVEGYPASVLVEASKDAQTLVLGSRQLHSLGSFFLGSVGAAVVARAACPVVITRGPAGEVAERAQVVVGVDGSEDSEAVLSFAFDYASRHHVDLHAVLCRHGYLPSLGFFADEIATASLTAEAWLSEAMAGWREKYPDVAASQSVIADHPVRGLVAASTAQLLLVVGSRTQYARTGSLLGSVSQGVLHHATCPVAVVNR